MADDYAPKHRADRPVDSPSRAKIYYVMKARARSLMRVPS